MAILKNELEKIAALASIGMNSENSTQLAHDVATIMNFVEQLRSVNTIGITPLHHPLDQHQHQRLRVDEVREENQVSKLASIAPLFADDLYLVPKVIDIGK